MVWAMVFNPVFLQTLVVALGRLLQQLLNSIVAVQECDATEV